MDRQSQLSTNCFTVSGVTISLQLDNTCQEERENSIRWSIDLWTPIKQGLISIVVLF